MNGRLKPKAFEVIFGEIVESTVFSTLVLVAFGLLLTVTGGIAYLTISDWRDRRRQEKAREKEKRR
ncbi:hypothetical protein [Phormidesmis priestleyi]